MAFRITGILTKKNLVIVIFLLAIVLRFYRFEEYVTFLGDEGRDAIIMKRIVTLEHLPAIGPSSSIGQVFLGPFYYYLVAPFLLFFGFSPVGPAVGVALFSLLGILLAYLIVKKEEGWLTSFFFLVFVSFSIIQIQMSRYSWNPNLLPIFSFLSLFFLFKLIATKRKIYALLLGAFLSFSIQLHHLAFLLIPPIAVVYLMNRFSVKKITSDFIHILVAGGSFVFFSLPLILFDLRHEFINTKSFLRLFGEKNIVQSGSLFSRFVETNTNLYSHIFQTPIHPLAASVFTAGILLFFFRKIFGKQNFLQIYLVNFIFYIFSFSFLNSFRHPHYYGPVYFSFFVVLASVLTSLIKKTRVAGAVIFPFLFLYLFLNLRQVPYFDLPGGNQIRSAEKTADAIIRQQPRTPFQVVALPFTATDGHIRYFLEVKGYRPLPADTLADPKELYVLCYEKKCQVLGNAQWQIAAFKSAKIDTIFESEGILIYKVVHERS